MFYEHVPEIPNLNDMRRKLNIGEDVSPFKSPVYCKFCTSEFVLHNIFYCTFYTFI